MLVGQFYGPLRDLEVFNQVRIDPEVQTLVWPNSADFELATLMIGQRLTVSFRR